MSSDESSANAIDIPLTLEPGALVDLLARRVVERMPPGDLVPSDELITDVVCAALAPVEPRLLWFYNEAARLALPRGPSNTGHLRWPDAPTGWHRQTAANLIGAVKKQVEHLKPPTDAQMREAAEALSTGKWADSIEEGWRP